MASSLLEVADLACRRGGRKVFERLSFAVGPGELLALVGRNGHIGIILALLDESDSTVYSRVLAKPQISDQNAFAQSLEEIRLELAVRAGNIPADLRKMLKEQDSVLSYRVA